MFTGIIEEVGQIEFVSGNTLAIKAHKVTKNVMAGDSISVNGICLTVTRFDGQSFIVDIMQETLSRTNLKNCIPGDKVNLESALTLNKHLGGHLLQGHIDSTGTIESIYKNDSSTIIRINAPAQVMRYVVEKGFIGIDGMSLTVVSRDNQGFSVSIVNYTLMNTRIPDLKIGDEVNLEAYIIAKYVDQILSLKNNESNINLEFLKEHGFLF